MPKSDRPRFYLITPSSVNLASFADTLAATLDAHDVACVRLALGDVEEHAYVKAADALRPVCEARDVALVISEHYRLAHRLGLDGVHLTDGARQVREARKSLGDDAIVGTFAHTSRHDGLTAGEAGADYISFGPVTQSTLGDGLLAPIELFRWWSEMIEIPVVAEGGLAPEVAAKIGAFTDFVALGKEIWSHPSGPVAALDEFAAAFD